MFLDEFQDCTNVQYSLLRKAFNSESALLTAVGDTKQRIMAWAGALEGIFGKFAADYGAQPLYLYQNYRSAPRIRRVQNAMVRAMESAAALPDDQLLGDEGDVAVEHFTSSVDEAHFLADSVSRWLDEGVLASDIAVLVRQQARFTAHDLMEELRTQGIAFRNEQEVQDVFAEPLGQLIIDFLSVAIHTRQPAAYGRLMSVIAPSTDDNECDHVNAARWRRRIDQARQILRNPESDGAQLIAEVKRFLGDVGQDRLLALSPAYGDRARYDQLLGDILDGLATMAEHGDGQLAALTHVNDDGAVRILTIHKAKGLEFHTVVVLGVENQTFWGRDVGANRAEYFVAISRAKKRLVLTSVGRRSRPPGAGRWDQARTPQQEFLGYAAGEVNA